MPTQWIYGYHAMKAVYEEAPHKLKQVFFSKQRIDSSRVTSLVTAFQKTGIAIKEISADKLTRLTGTEDHQGMAAEVPIPKAISLESWLSSAEPEISSSPKVLLALEKVTDPRNLGACFRIAHAAGIAAIITNRSHASPITPLVRKAACGATEWLPWITVSRCSVAVNQLKQKGFVSIGLAHDAEKSLYELDFSDKDVLLLLGSEEKGLTAESREACDFLMKIPMKSGSESLNVASAASIAAFELARQQSFPFPKA